MKHYAGLDVSVKETSICIVDEAGRICRQDGHADILTTHVEAALTHAQAGEKAKANPHCKEAIKHLKQAIYEGKKGHADAATTAT